MLRLEWRQQWKQKSLQVAVAQTVDGEPEAIRALRDYSWPGNVRELRNLISKASIFASGLSTAPADLSLAAHDAGACRDLAPPFNLDRIEREMVFKALSKASGHHDKAARMLGISRRTLCRKLKIYEAHEALLA